MNKEIKALYIHIPFCTNICSYCDFYKMRAKIETKEEYVKTLISELYFRQNYLKSIKTIYIGGGTPSSLPINLLRQLFIALSTTIDITKIEEFTVEINPSDVNLELANLLKEFSVNRISLGIQSFQKAKLELLGRNHDENTCKQAVKILKETGFSNISADLIFGLPIDTIMLIRRDIAKVINLGLTHISYYALMLEEKTVLYHKYRKKEFFPLSDDKLARLYKYICRTLNLYGYKQYEISNFAKKSYQSIHNQVYWNNERYLGLGAGASYYLNDTRYMNECNLNRYKKAVLNNEMTYQEEMPLDKTTQMIEEVMLGLRQIKGINLESFYNKYGLRISEVFPITKTLLKKKLLVIKKGHIFIPQKKFFISNSIILYFI